MTGRVLCQATVEPTPGQTAVRSTSAGQWWTVTVTGQSPHDERRVYSIRANDDNNAAREGIDRFVAEMEARQSA